MANVVLRERLTGGFEGSIDVTPALTWADREALQRTADGAMASAVQLGGIHMRLAMLEAQLGLRLDAQTRILEAQRNVLERIDAALRRPGQVSAAERIANTGELLRRGRYARALSDAELAIGDDPNNPAGFSAAGWAAVGLGRGEHAAEFFLEAAQASDGEQKATALRQAARITFALKDGSAALEIVNRRVDGLDEFQQAALEYDRAVYLAASGEQAGAASALRLAFAVDDRFAAMAVTDEILASDPAVRGVADGLLLELGEAIARRREDVTRELASADDALASFDGALAPEHAADRTRLEELARALRRQLAEQHESESLRAHQDALTTLAAAATRLHEQAASWAAAARDAYDRRQAAARDAEERKQAAAAARAAGVQEQVAELAEAARAFAEEKQATLAQRPDGSWLITRERRLAGGRAWLAHSHPFGPRIVSIPWSQRS